VFQADCGNGGATLDFEHFRLAVTYLQFPVQVCFSASVGHRSSCSGFVFLLRDLETWPMVLTFELDLDSVKLNQRVGYLGQRSFSSKVIVSDTHMRPSASSEKVNGSSYPHQDHWNEEMRNTRHRTSNSWPIIIILCISCGQSRNLRRLIGLVLKRDICIALYVCDAHL